MKMLAKAPELGRLVLEPLRGRTLVFASVTVWLAGAAYCHGYEDLLTGLANWPGSLIWSAIAVLPWFGLFEWSKTKSGHDVTRNHTRLAALLLAIAAASIALESFVNWLLGNYTSKLGLLILRRLPAIAATLMLIALRRNRRLQEIPPDADDLRGLASSIEYVVAADNYVELHLPGRVTLRRMTLVEVTRLLHDHGFIRVHRRFLVNRVHIQAIQRQRRGFVQLRSGAKIPIGRAYSRNIPTEG